MSYQGDDKWGAYIRRFSEDSPSLAGLKEKIKKHLKETEISKVARVLYTNEEYQITDVKLTIKKVKK